MRTQSITRRWFIGGATAFGALGGCRLLHAPSSFKAGDVPRLRFGVVSDIHVRLGNTETFEHALEYFRDNDVDAVAVCGDMSDVGLICDLESVAATWRRVFPGGRAPDGRKVERLFLYGNHDWEGYHYSKGKIVRSLFWSDEDMRSQLLCSDYARNWERVFEEPFSPIWTKEVNGYRFVGAHWIADGDVNNASCNGVCEKFNPLVRDYYARHAREIDPSLPFFHLQHPHPKDTCYGSWAWGRDDGLTTAALSSFPNAIALSGHSHYSLTDERSVWQGAFTSVGTSSLRYGSMTYGQNAPVGFENAGATGDAAHELNAVKLLESMETGDCRQGMLWSVYDDCIVIRRREFVSDLDLDGNWVLPLPAAESKPFAFVERAKKIRPARFAPDAKLSVEFTKAKNRKGDEKAVLNVIIPSPLSDVYARAFLFEVTVHTADGKKHTKLVQAEGYNQALAHRRAKEVTTCPFAVDMLGIAPYSISVTPIDCFDQRGEPLLAEYR